MKIRIGIDPGGSGCVAIWREEDNSFEYKYIPKIGKFIDTHEMSKIFDNIDITQDVHCVIEDVHALFNSSARSTFSFGYVCGMLEMLIVKSNIPYTKVQPKVWQKQMWAGIPIQKKPSSSGKTMVNDTKLMSLMAAKRIFPNIDFRKSERSRIPDDNKVDAILMCEYCKRNF